MGGLTGTPYKEEKILGTPKVAGVKKGQMPHLTK